MIDSARLHISPIQLLLLHTYAHIDVLQNRENQGKFILDNFVCLFPSLVRCYYYFSNSLMKRKQTIVLLFPYIFVSLSLSSRTIHIVYLVICVCVFFHETRNQGCIVIVICLDVKIK